MLGRLSIAAVLLFSLLVVPGCAGGGQDDPCSGVACSGHGVCAVDQGQPRCFCDAGFYAEGLDCLPEADPCAGEDCSGHGTCQLQDDAPACVCDLGFHAEGLACVHDELDPPCAGVDCSGHGRCVVLDGAAACECDLGYIADGLACLADDPCRGVACSGHGACLVLEGVAVCQCEPGYLPSGTQCLPEPDDGSGPVWFVHVSDMHFGQSAVASAMTRALVDEVIPTIEPAVSVNSGDVTDGGTAAQWSSYRAIVDGAVPAYPAYLEIVGNHDVKDDELPAFLAESVVGRAGEHVHGQTFVERAGGRIRLLRTNTADSSNNPLNIAGIFGQAQFDALSALDDLDPPSRWVVAAGHHPLTGLERLYLGFDRMQQLLAAVGARVYFCGHVHRQAFSWLGETLISQANSLGKSEVPALALVALGQTGPAARFVAMEPFVSWPLVLITTPADPDLGGQNPYAAQIQAGGQLTVRAIAFAPGGVDELVFQLGDRVQQGAPVAPDVFETTYLLPASPAELELSATATAAAGTGRHALTVTVAP